MKITQRIGLLQHYPTSMTIQAHGNRNPDTTTVWETWRQDVILRKINRGTCMKQNTSHLRPHVAVFYVDLSRSPNSKLKSDLLIRRAWEFACNISIWNQHDTVALSINVCSTLIQLLNSPPHKCLQKKNNKVNWKSVYVMKLARKIDPLNPSSRIKIIRRKFEVK
jgi:hypothetical protein